MKTIIIIPLLLSLKIMAQNKPVFEFEAGTSNKLTPVVAMSGGYGFNTKNDNLKLITSVSIRSHVDNKNIAFGALNAGFEYFNIGVFGGIAYGGNIGKDDHYINNQGETITLLKDVKRGHFVSPVASLRYLLPLGDNTFYLQSTYCQKVIFAGVGIKCIIGE